MKTRKKQNSLKTPSDNSSLSYQIQLSN